MSPGGHSPKVRPVRTEGSGSSGAAPLGGPCRRAPVSTSPGPEGGFADPVERRIPDAGHGDRRGDEELVKAGILQAGEGLHPSSAGKRVHFSGGRRTVTDGPFGPPGEESTLEIRRIYEAEDFGDALTTELREQEERLRAASGKGRGR